MNRAWNTLMLDGDFKVQLSRHLTQAELELHSRFELHVLATNRTAIYDTHLDFLRAGSAIIRTNTYRASVQSFTEYMQTSRSEGIHLIKVAAELARKAVVEFYKEIGGDTSNPETFNSTRPLVAGCCGSYAVANFDEIDNCPPFWDYMSRHDLAIWHKSRIQALLDAGVDMLIFDSISSGREARALIEVLRAFPQATAWITFFCRNDDVLMDGRCFLDTAMQCYLALPRQISAIGIHCKSPSLVTLELRKIYGRPYSNIPLIVCSDKNFVYDDDNSSFTCDLIMRHVREWLTMGVRCIGGGIEVNADDIEDIFYEVQSYYTEHTTVQNANANVPNACSFQNKRNKSKM